MPTRNWQRDTDDAERTHVVPYGVMLAEHEAKILREVAERDARVIGEIAHVAPVAPAPVRGVVSATYRRPWSMAYQTAVNALLVAAGVSNRGETGLLSAAELDEMGEAMHDGTTPEQFASRIIDRAARENERVERDHWLADFQEGASCQ